ncbi:basic proline-rich protein-like [Hyaena hyaena]|uniref:basic proline-rich protein-like n=1 Tax=Hyaena hyaena TaxID=95912 RepID=UPI0019211CB8|nr:basic proline-rich protein-like [Hyaena hyaena]
MPSLGLNASPAREEAPRGGPGELPGGSQHPGAPAAAPPAAPVPGGSATHREPPHRTAFRDPRRTLAPRAPEGAPKGGGQEQKCSRWVRGPGRVGRGAGSQPAHGARGSSTATPLPALPAARRPTSAASAPRQPLSSAPAPLTWAARPPAAFPSLALPGRYCQSPSPRPEPGPHWPISCFLRRRGGLAEQGGEERPPPRAPAAAAPSACACAGRALPRGPASRPPRSDLEGALFLNPLL